MMQSRVEPQMSVFHNSTAQDLRYISTQDKGCNAFRVMSPTDLKMEADLCTETLVWALKSRWCYSHIGEKLKTYVVISMLDLTDTERFALSMNINFDLFNRSTYIPRFKVWTAQIEWRESLVHVLFLVIGGKQTL
jgi:hypothetical protein